MTIPTESTSDRFREKFEFTHSGLSWRDTKINVKQEEILSFIEEEEVRAYTKGRTDESLFWKGAYEKSVEQAKLETREEMKKKLWNLLVVDSADKNHFYDTVYKFIGVDNKGSKESLSTEGKE